ncbi:MAG: lipase maturation factor family protein [Planctomycetes bacterium]|nr:lipase maturation factor family protein [Planctomycetota bacterium]
MPTSFLAPELVWGLLPRVVGAAFLIAFVSLSRQVVPLVGSRGVSPLRHRIARLRRDVPAPRRLFEMPGLVWLSHSDAALAALPWLGASGALLAIVGGPAGFFGLLLCWLCWLSLDVCGLWLPWDTLLLEAGFLALFLPATHALPDVHAVAAPLASVAFLFRWLLIRLMWGFAKLKFVGTEKGDGMYLQGFLTWLPMPTPLGWLFQKAPKLALRAGCAFMWTAEVVAPLLCCFDGTPRLVGAALLVLLMTGIQSTGNWGHFNLAYAGLCVLLLDTRASVLDVFGDGAASGASQAHATFVNACMAAHFVAGLALFPLNSWVTQAATQWNADRFTWRRPWLERLLRVVRLVNRLRLVGAYGVFPPNTSPPIKMVPVLEGSHDGRTWTTIPWRFMPVDERSPPRFVAPHHPRLDHSSIYVGLGLEEGDPVGGLMFEVKPYGCSPYSRHTWLQRVVQRVLEGEPGVLGLLGPDPFGERRPTWVRVVHVCLKPTSLAERRRSGRWWHARTMCVLHEPVRSDPSLWQHWIAEPEGVHPELTHWRRRSPALARLRAAVEEALLSEAEARTALCTAGDLDPSDVAAFWDDFVPWLAAPGRRDDWDALPRTVTAARERFGVERLRAFERVHQRAVHVLEARVEPHAYGAAVPHWDVANAFDLYATLGAVVLDGERAWARLYRDPGRVVARAASLDEAALLFPTALFRWEHVRSLVLGLRARTRLSRAPPMPWGIGRHERFLLAVDAGPQWFPTCIRSDDGSWTVPAEPFEAGHSASP